MKRWKKCLIDNQEVILTCHRCGSEALVELTSPATINNKTYNRVCKKCGRETYPCFTEKIN